MDGLVGLIADSFEVEHQQQERHQQIQQQDQTNRNTKKETRRTNTIKSPRSMHHGKRAVDQTRTIHSTAAAASTTSATAAATASTEAATAQYVSSLTAKLTREKQLKQAEFDHERRVNQQRLKRTQNERQFPKWQLDLPIEGQPGTARPWTMEDQLQFSTLLATRNDGVCSCDREEAPTSNKRRKIAHHSISVSSTSSGCCLQRLVHIGDIMHRSLADIQSQLQLWQQQSCSPDSELALVPFLAESAISPEPTLSPETIARRWAEQDECDTIFSTQYGNQLLVVPRWSPTRIHELMTAVQDERSILEEKRMEIKEAERAAQPQDEVADDSSVEEQSVLSDKSKEVIPIFDLPLTSWSRIGAALHPPDSGAHAHTVYFHVLGMCGYPVPPELAILPAFHFPSKDKYDAYPLFDYSGPASDPDEQLDSLTPESEDEDGLDDDDDDDAEEHAGSTSAVGPHPRRSGASFNRSVDREPLTPEAQQEIMRQVRKSVQHRTQRREDETEQVCE